MNSVKARQRRLNQVQALRRADDDNWIPTQRVYTGKPVGGVRVNADNALTLAAVWACTRYLSQSISTLPWQVRKPAEDLDDDSSTWAKKHPVQSILRRPSLEWSSAQFRETLTHWALRRGNGYAEIERDIMGRALALYPIHPDRVEVLRDKVTGRLFYKVDNGNDPDGFVDQMDMFHIRGFGEGPVGLNVMAYAAESLGWAKAAQLFSASFFGNNATPAGIVTMKKPLKPEGLKALQNRFHQLNGGARGNNRTVFLDNEMEYQSVTVDQNKAQFIETQQHLIDDICRWFGVPPHKIYHLLRATFSNIEHQSIEVVQDSLVPWAKRFEDEADFKLFGTQNRQGFYTKIQMRDLLRGDTKTRLEYYRGLREIGVLNADEIRELEDMAPIGTADGGEKRVMQGQYTTLEKIGEEPEPAPAPAPAPGEDPAEPEPAPEPEPEEDQAAEDRRRMGRLVAGLMTIERTEIALCGQTS
jgi:HK97 family phage portal protein